MKYQILEHTADLKIRAFGKSKEEVFANLALGMFENIVTKKDILKNQPVKHKIRVKSGDLSALLVDFLSKLVTLSDINDEVYMDYRLEIRDNRLTGEIKGYKVKKLKMEIKAVTYNDLKIGETGGKWLVDVVFDI